MTDLTPRQMRFVLGYMVDLNGTQAAIRAGYSPKTADQQASRLLTNVKVAAEVERRQAKAAEKLEISADRVLRELAKIGFANMADYVKIDNDGDPYIDLSGLSRDQMAAVAEVVAEDFKDSRGENARDVRRVKFKLHDKRAALVDLGKHLGIFSEKNKQKDLTLEALVLASMKRREERASSTGSGG